jgi:hypothetical protein
MSSDEHQEEGTPTPTPVRELMGAESSPPRARGDADPPVERTPLRAVFRTEGEEWIAEEIGKTRTGEASDSGAVLLLLGFHRAGDVGAGDESAEGEQGAPRGDEPEREAWSVARSVEDLSEVQLVELLARSREWRKPDEGDSGTGRRPGPGRQRLRTAGAGD